LQTFAHAMSPLEHQRVVTGVYITNDVGDRVETANRTQRSKRTVWQWSAGTREIYRRVLASVRQRAWQSLRSGRSAYRISDCSGRRKIRVNEVRQFTTKAAQITCRNHCIPSQFMLNNQVCLMNLRIL